MGHKYFIDPAFQLGNFLHMNFTVFAHPFNIFDNDLRVLSPDNLTLLKVDQLIRNFRQFCFEEMDARIFFLNYFLQMEPILIAFEHLFAGAIVSDIDHSWLGVNHVLVIFLLPRIPFAGMIKTGGLFSIHDHCFLIMSESMPLKAQIDWWMLIVKTFKKSLFCFCDTCFKVVINAPNLIQIGVCNKVRCTNCWIPGLQCFKWDGMRNRMGSAAKVSIGGRPDKVRTAAHKIKYIGYL